MTVVLLFSLPTPPIYTGMAKVNVLSLNHCASEIYKPKMPLMCKPHLPKDRKLSEMLGAVVHVRLKKALVFTSRNKFGCPNHRDVLDHMEVGSTRQEVRLDVCLPLIG